MHHYLYNDLRHHHHDHHLPDDNLIIGTDGTGGLFPQLRRVWTLGWHRSQGIVSLFCKEQKLFLEKILLANEQILLTILKKHFLANVMITSEGRYVDR